MTYTRVIPRDLFNEANFLKCLGQVYIKAEAREVSIKFWDIQNDEELESTDQAFPVGQTESGNLILQGIGLNINEVVYEFRRPLNARSCYPLYITTETEEYTVFTEDGEFSQEFLTLAGVYKTQQNRSTSDAAGAKQV